MSRSTEFACATRGSFDVTANQIYNVRLIGFDSNGAVQTLGAAINVVFAPDQ